MPTDSQKINYIYKKIFGKPTSLINDSLLQEPNSIFGNNIITTTPIFSTTHLFRDIIPNTVPSSLISTNLDNNGNTIIGSIIGKTDSTNIITKFVKIPMYYIPGSKITDSNNNIIGIAFYLKLLENSIPYNYDPEGSYNYQIYRYNTSTNSYIELNFKEGDWIVDNETGILTFFNSMNSTHSIFQHITNINPPYITFYKYTGSIGLYPITFNKNESVIIKTNLNIEENLNVLKNSIIEKDLLVKKNLTINNNLSLSNIHFTKLTHLPTDTTSNQLVYVGNNLYFSHNNEWLRIGNDNLILQNNEQFIFQHDQLYNILNVNTNISIIEITQTLVSNIYIILPNIQKTGIEKTIIMGQSVSKYGNNQNIILYSNYMDVDGNGPIYMNIKFISSGQSIKLISVVSSNSSIFGNGNKYWQIVNGHFDSTDNFQYDSNGNLINTNDSGSIFQSTVNDTQYESMTNILSNPINPNVLINTHYINVNGSNILSLNSEIILLQIGADLLSNKTITLNTETKSGEKKTILVGDSFNSYKNNFYITIQSTYMGGYNTEFLTSITQSNIKFIKSGQSVNLISMKATDNSYYWHVLNGDFTFV